MKILCHTPTKDDAPSMYRGWGVMTELERLNINCIFSDTFGLYQLKGCSALYLQRPDRKKHCEAIDMAKGMNIPVIVDYDDNLLEVPKYNKYHIEMSKHEPDYVKSVAYGIQNADMVWVSTDKLKEEFTKYNTNIHVVRNAFDDYLYRPQGFSRKKTVLWRGSKTHTQDLDCFREPLKALFFENQDFEFVFIGDGYPTWLLDTQSKNITFVDPVYTYDFFNCLKVINPSVMIVPLEDTLFNYCKSDIAAIEAVASGSLCIAPDWHEWNWLGNNYSDTRSFYATTSALLGHIRAFNPELIKYHASLQDDLKNRYLSKANALRRHLCCTLTNATIAK